MTAEAKLWKSADPLKLVEPGLDVGAARVRTIPPSKLVEPIRERQRADRVETKTTAIGDLYPGLPFDCPVVSTQPLASLTSWLNQLQGRKPTPRFNQPGMGANVFPSCMRVQAEDRIFPR